MIIEEDVKALSEILRATKVEFYTEKREVCLAQLLNISDSLNLARVALEWVEGREAPELKHWGEADSIYDETEEPK